MFRFARPCRACASHRTAMASSAASSSMPSEPVVNRYEYPREEYHKMSEGPDQRESCPHADECGCDTHCELKACGC